MDLNLSELFQTLKQLLKLCSLELLANVGFGTLISFLKYNWSFIVRWCSWDSKLTSITNLSYYGLWMNTQLLLRVCKSLGISLLIYDVFHTLEEARIVEVSQLCSI